MSARKAGVLLLVVVLSGLVVWLAYQLVDTAVSLDYARQGQQLQRARETILRSMLLRTVSDMSRTELVRLIKEGFEKTHIIKEEPDRLEVDDIVFLFHDEAITGIAILGDEESATVLGR